MSAIHIFLCVFQLPVCLVDYSTIVPCGDLFSVILVKLGTLFPQTPFLVGVWLESARSGVFGDLEGEGKEAIPLKIMAIKCPSGGSFSSLPSQPAPLTNQDHHQDDEAGPERHSHPDTSSSSSPRVAHLLVPQIMGLLLSTSVPPESPCPSSFPHNKALFQKSQWFCFPEETMTLSLMFCLVLFIFESENESHFVVSDSLTPWTIKSMEFSRPEYWSG